MLTNWDVIHGWLKKAKADTRWVTKLDLRTFGTKKGSVDPLLIWHDRFVQAIFPAMVNGKLKVRRTRAGSIEMRLTKKAESGR